MILGLAASIVQTSGDKYLWSAQLVHNPFLDFTKPPASAPPARSPAFETRLVCYCDAKGGGWRWEAHVDTRAVYFVNDNADLMSKYGLSASK